MYWRVMWMPLQVLSRNIRIKLNLIVQKQNTVLEAALENTDALTPDVIERILQMISTHESVFTEKEIAKAVSHLTEQAR